MNDEYDDEYSQEFIDYMTADMMPCGCTSDEQHERQRSAMESVSHILEVVRNEDKMVKVRMHDGACDGTMFIHESHLPEATISKTETVAPEDRCQAAGAARAIRMAQDIAESNSSAPLTGWTKDWPTEPGWWWVSGEHLAPDEVVALYFERHYPGDEIWAYDLIRSDISLRFHAMEQPPLPPKEDEA